MNVEHGTRDEAFCAQVTNVRSLASVTPHVYHQAGTLRESARAELARVRFLAGVDSLVLDENRFLRETLAAVRAAERFVARMRAHVELKLLLARQGPAADVADRDVSSVDVHVQLEAVLVLVGLLADDALVQTRGAHELVFVYRVAMGDQVTRVRKVLAAEFARERFLARMIVFVLLQPGLHVKPLRALATLVLVVLLVRVVQVISDFENGIGLELAQNTTKQLLLGVQPQVHRIIDDLPKLSRALFAIKLIAVRLHVLLQALQRAKKFRTDVALYRVFNVELHASQPFALVKLAEVSPQLLVRHFLLRLAYVTDELNIVLAFRQRFLFNRRLAHSNGELTRATFPFFRERCIG